MRIKYRFQRLFRDPGVASGHNVNIDGMRHACSQLHLSVPPRASCGRATPVRAWQVRNDTIC